ncbi:hypothetical protein [uncultured Roseibium sp.]|uniref:hypothetical protein n=1 Tax=uncultured Roseibium sp. TaxID=1936171 RepID=UPI00261A7B2A|nr:hypothetical protein [uncultured Roseibium sp.]
MVTKYDISVFEAKLNMTLYAHTYYYAEPQDAEYVKDRFITNNPRYKAIPQHVHVDQRTD